MSLRSRPSVFDLKKLFESFFSIDRYFAAAYFVHQLHPVYQITKETFVVFVLLTGLMQLTVKEVRCFECNISGTFTNHKWGRFGLIRHTRSNKISYLLFDPQYLFHHHQRHHHCYCLTFALTSNKCKKSIDRKENFPYDEFGDQGCVRKRKHNLHRDNF